jgi:hypothetical protein
MKALSIILDYVAGALVGFSVAWTWRSRIATTRYNLLKALYHNYRDNEGKRFLGKGYNLGFEDAFKIIEKEEAEDEYAMAKEELADAIDAWKADSEMTLTIYPFVNRPWGRD